MNHLETCVVAGLLVDLAELFEAATIELSEQTRRVLALARPAEPALQTMLAQARAYAGGGGAGRSLRTDQPLISIFSRVEKDEPAPTCYQTLAPLPPTTARSLEALFPVASPPQTNLEPHLRDLAADLAWLADEVGLDQFRLLYTHLLALLQRYTWCLPGSGQDISLFDQAKLTAAMAAVLVQYHQADLQTAAIEAGAEAERFCLIVGDLSGIQDYIFDITSIGAGGGVAKRLRARSFYLSILADVLSHQVAQRFGVPLGNVIMASGGKFYILVPNQTGLAGQVEHLQQEIDHWFHQQFNGEIAVHLAHVAFAGSQFRAGEPGRPGFGGLVAGLSLQLNREKRRPGRGILTGTNGWNQADFIIERDFWGAGACISCGKFSADPARENLCEQCWRDAQIGQKLPRVRYVAYYADDSGAMPMPLGCSARVLAPDELEPAGQPYLVTRLNHPEIRELAGLPGSFRYLANYIPVNNFRNPFSFEEIAREAQGRPLLGYVKADVDYLGTLFALGLQRDGQGYDTATHLAALSRSLDLFFSGWMQHTLSQTYPNFYTIFSGGDDLFLVGPWSEAHKLAQFINDGLAEFTGGNPNITLSAGILFTKDRYPISRAAEDAEEKLEHSKDKGRSRLTLLGRTLPWSDVPAVLAEIERLERHAAVLTSAFLYDLIEYSRLYRLWAEEKKVEGLRYKALFAYNIARNLRKGNADLYRWADGLMQSLGGGGEPFAMRYLDLISTYVLFSRREPDHAQDEQKEERSEVDQPAESG